MVYAPGRKAGLNAYAKVGLETSVESASPHQMIVLLFNGALTSVAHAKLHLERGAIPDRGMAISKAINIVQNGLQASLNLEAGGEVAANLHNLYDYVVRTLLTANLNADASQLDTVTSLLTDLRDAWMAIAPETPAPQQSVVASS